MGSLLNSDSGNSRTAPISEQPVPTGGVPPLSRSAASYIEKDIMDLLEQYLDRANEIIGDRTKEEERYDKEVLMFAQKV